MRWTTWLADLRQDVVAGIRQFRKAPGFTAAAVLTIALGIGATTAIFGMVHAVVLRPLPFAAPERIAFVTEFWRDQPSDVSVGNSVDWRAASSDLFSHLAAVNYTNLNVADGSEPERVRQAGSRAGSSSCSAWRRCTVGCCAQTRTARAATASSC